VQLAASRRGCCTVRLPFSFGLVPLVADLGKVMPMWYPALALTAGT